MDTVIPGHSAVTTWKSFEESGQFMQALVSATEAAMKAGKTADQAAASLSLPEQFKDYDMKQLKADIDVIYAELEEVARVRGGGSVARRPACPASAPKPLRSGSASQLPAVL